MRSLAQTGPAQRRKSTACASTSTCYGLRYVGPRATTVPASVSGCAVVVQFSLTVHAVPSHIIAGFSFRVVASSARAIPAQMWADFVGVVHESVHVSVDFNFNAHGPLQLRRVSVSVRNQLPIRPVSGSVSSDSLVMNASSLTIPAQFFAALFLRRKCAFDLVANVARLSFGAVASRIQRTRLGE